MNFNQFRISYHIFITLFRVMLIAITLLWVKNTYYYFQASNIYEYFRDFRGIAKTMDTWLPILMVWGKEALFYIGSFIFFSFLISLFRKFPILDKWLDKWDSNGEISTILGKKIALHFRYNQSINCETILHLNYLAKLEKNLLKFHSENEIKKAFLLKYDSEFNEDLKN